MLQSRGCWVCGTGGQSVGKDAGVQDLGVTSISPSDSPHWLHIRMKTESLKKKYWCLGPTPRPIKSLRMLRSGIFLRLPWHSTMQTELITFTMSGNCHHGRRWAPQGREWSMREKKIWDWTSRRRKRESSERLGDRQKIKSGPRIKGKRDSWSGKLILVSSTIAKWNKRKNIKDPLDLPTKRYQEHGGNCLVEEGWQKPDWRGWWRKWEVSSGNSELLKQLCFEVEQSGGKPGLGVVRRGAA